MIIGFDASRAFCKERTGTENYSYQLLKALADLDQKNHYIIYLRPQEESLCGWPGNFQFKKINWPRFWTQGGLALETFTDNLDVLFVPAHTLPVLRRPGLKTVVTVHDLGSEYLPSLHQLKQRLYLGFMQKIQLKGATKIIAVSKATRDDLIKKTGINRQKISVVYEGYNKEFKSVKHDALVNTLTYYKPRPQEYYFFVGTVQPRKNIGRMIKAFCSVQGDFKLVIAGQKGWLSDKIFKLPENAPVERIKFLGYVPDNDLAALYSGARAFCYPSLFEGFGLPVLEAQAAGCPVLTSNLSSMPEVAGEGAIYVDPYNTHDIVKGMEKLKNKEERIKLIQKGFENIKRFSWEQCAEETLNVLQSV